MGNYLSTNSDQSQLNVWYLNKNKRIHISLTSTLKELQNQLYQIDLTPKQIFFDWIPIDQSDLNITLKQVIQNHSNSYPNTNSKDLLFTVIDSFEENLLAIQKETRQNKILTKLKKIQPITQNHIKNYQRGRNGNIIFQNRQTSIFASAITYAIKSIIHDQQKTKSLFQLLESKQKSINNLTLIEKFFQYFGLLKENSELLTTQQLSDKLQSIKSSTDFSDFDPKFVYYIIQIYLKFMIKSRAKIQYIDYKNIEDFNIQCISSKSKIGIIGDFGTGLKDSIQLLKNMILKHDVNVIFHLGDVYYAGTPQQYQVGIIQPLKKLRIQTKKQIRFYSIPGNHDYYSWGLPFLCFVKGINQKEFQQQKSSYFCIKDDKNKWQFLGIDTAFHDSNPLNQIYPFGIGPYAQQKELIWHKHRLLNFKGSTILMTHHQLFSIHERINGQLTKYRQFSCISPILCSQMFEHMNDIQAWFWGHQHSLMFFRQNLLGLSKGRLLGNSSFHVMYQKEHPYQRAKDFPKIPFIVQDEQYLKRYLPVNPNLMSDDYFGLSYAIIDLQKIDQQNNLKIQYWCSPSYSNEEYEKINNMLMDEKNKVYFNEYKLYEQSILSIDNLKKQRIFVKNSDKIYLRCQIGLSLKLFNCQLEKEFSYQIQNYNQNSKSQTILTSKEANNRSLILKLEGSPFQIQFINENTSQRECHLEFTLKLNSENKFKNLYIGILNGNVELIDITSKNQLVDKNCIWICQYFDLKNNKQYKQALYYGEPFKILNKNIQKSLTWQIIKGKGYPSLQDIQINKKQNIKQQKQNIAATSLQCLWKFEKQNLIKQ